MTALHMYDMTYCVYEYIKAGCYRRTQVDEVISAVSACRRSRSDHVIFGLKMITEYSTC